MARELGRFYGHTRLGEWIFGGVTRGLLDQLPVLTLSRELAALVQFENRQQIRLLSNRSRVTPPKIHSPNRARP
jgi:hypothetical protein